MIVMSNLVQFLVLCIIPWAYTYNNNFIKLIYTQTKLKGERNGDNYIKQRKLTCYFLKYG